MLLFLGILISSAFASFVAFLLRLFYQRFHKYAPPDGVSEELWLEAFQIPEVGKKPLIILGLLESWIAFISFWIGKPELLFAWLAFKVASKWEGWSTISKVPENIDTINPLSYLGAKNRVASYTLQRWLIGTLCNIIAGFLGVRGTLFLDRYFSLSKEPFLYTFVCLMAIVISICCIFKLFIEVQTNLSRIKRIIAREGLVLLAIIVTRLLCEAYHYSNFGGETNPNYRPILNLTIIIIYSFYWLIRFIIWALRILKEK